MLMIFLSRECFLITKVAEIMGHDHGSYRHRGNFFGYGGTTAKPQVFFPIPGKSREYTDLVPIGVSVAMGVPVGYGTGLDWF